MTNPTGRIVHRVDDLPHDNRPRTPSQVQRIEKAGLNCVASHYLVGRKIGEGSFGMIYEGSLYI